MCFYISTLRAELVFWITLVCVVYILMVMLLCLLRHGLGDCHKPLGESAVLIEQIVHKQIVSLVSFFLVCHWLCAHTLLFSYVVMRTFLRLSQKNIEFYVQVILLVIKVMYGHVRASENRSLKLQYAGHLFSNQSFGF